MKVVAKKTEDRRKKMEPVMASKQVKAPKEDVN